jgi:hypothetical protein
MFRDLSKRCMGLAAVGWLICLLALASPVHAELVLSIDQPNQIASPGSTVDFTGTITNNTGFDMFATDLLVISGGYDPSVLSFTQLLGTPNFSIPNGSTTPDVSLFDVNVGLTATASGSPYLADILVQDDIGPDLSNDITIAIYVPEPGSMPLLLTSLALLIGFFNRRTLVAKLNMLLLRLSLAAAAILVVGSAHAAITPVLLFTENAATSVWSTDPTKVGVQLQIGNNGTAAGTNVQVTSFLVQGGSFSGPSPLPVGLGTINAGDSALLDVVITVPKTDGTMRYLLTFAGTYTYSGNQYGFTLNWPVVPNSAGPGTIFSQTGTSTIQNPSLVVYPVPPPQPPFLPNAETPIFIPVGPPSTTTPPATTGTGVGTPSPGGAVQIPVNTKHGTGPGVPPDPNAAAEGGGVVLATYNTSISYSTDGGAHFTDINLFTGPDPSNPSRTSFFPQSDGGLCCDQVVIYAPGPNLFFWLQQYWPITACATNCGPPPAKNATFKITQPDRERIAWATPDAIKTDFANAWTYIDLTAANTPGVSSGLGAASNEWVDYPDLALSSNYLYFAVDHGFPVPGKVYTGQRIVARLSLADITNTSASVVHYDYATLTGSNGLNKGHLVQDAPNQLVLGSLDNSSTLRVFTWSDSSNSIPSSTVGITQINQGSNYTSTAPDGTDWYSVSFPGNITGAVYRNVVEFGAPSQQQYYFAFDAGVNAGAGRPKAYVRLEGLMPSGGSNYNVFEEYDIWNPNYAFAMAGLGQDMNDVTPEIGINLAVGGGTVGYPQESVGYKDDFVVYQVTNSNATQISRFGDYLSARYIPGTDSQFAAEAYDVILNPLPPGVTSGTCATVGCTAQMRYIQFGRPPAPPPG